MIQQIKNSIIQKTEKVELELCSRCLSYEINNWINENWKYITDEARKEMLQELKTIRLKQGECIVCKNGMISDNTLGKILRILKENKTQENITKEFKKLFTCF